MAKIAAIVLAAGASSRMGEPKQLLRFGNRSLLDLALGAVSLPEIDRTIVVLGAHEDAIRGQVWLDEVEVVSNTNWSKGMVTSVQAGLRALLYTEYSNANSSGDGAATNSSSSLGTADFPFDFVVVLPCDYALVRPSTVAHLLLRALSLKDNPPPIISPSLMGRSGHPIVLSRAAIDDVLQLSPEVGLDTVVHIHRPERVLVEVDDPGIHFDIDTKDDYSAGLAAWEAIQSAREDVFKRLGR